MTKSGKKDSILREINDNPLSREEVIAFVTEVAKLSPEDRDFEGHAITAIRVLERKPGKALSIVFRMEALVRLIDQGLLPGWCREPDSPEDPWSVRLPIFAAAGVTPVFLDENGKVAFDKDELLKATFIQGKEEYEEIG